MKQEFFQTIDWSLLREQKEQLFSTLNAEHLLNPAQYEALEGLLMLIDSLQDYAVDVEGFTEQEVFNFKTNNNELT